MNSAIWAAAALESHLEDCSLSEECRAKCVMAKNYAGCTLFLIDVASILSKCCECTKPYVHLAMLEELYKRRQAMNNLIQETIDRIKSESNDPKVRDRLTNLIQENTENGQANNTNQTT